MDNGKELEECFAVDGTSRWRMLRNAIIMATFLERFLVSGLL
jgi:hypothetical protein